jgi:hypothetical protein
LFEETRRRCIYPVTETGAGQPEFTISATMMTHLTLIVPFPSRPVPATTPRTMSSRRAAAAVGVARARKVADARHPGPRETHDDPYLRTLPQERWLAGRAGLDTVRVPTAPFMRLADHRGPPRPTTPGSGWACLQPVHIHAARDHLVLMHPDQLDIRADEAAALRAAIAGLLDEAGIRSIPPPRPLVHARWHVRRPDCDHAGARHGPQYRYLDAGRPARATGAGCRTKSR